MKVNVQLTKGHVTIQRLPDGDVMGLIDDFRQGDSPVITLTIDDAVTHIARAHIVRIDIDPEDKA